MEQMVPSYAPLPTESQYGSETLIFSYSRNPFPEFPASLDGLFPPEFNFGFRGSVSGARSEYTSLRYGGTYVVVTVIKRPRCVLYRGPLLSSVETFGQSNLSNVRDIYIYIEYIHHNMYLSYVNIYIS